MKKITLILFLLLSILKNTQAQHLEIGGALGLGFYSGDLSHNLIATLGEAKGCYGLFVRQNFSEYTALKVHFNYGKISGKDSHASEPDFLARNLSFRSSILELGANFEYNITGYEPDGMYKPFSPYLLIGVAGFKYNPQTRYNNDWTDLRPLQTEAKNYGKYGFSIPIGGGVKYALNDHWNIGAELGFRPTFTDYLDDVSKNYVSRADLASRGGEVAADLGNKINAATGVKRGNDSGFDWYHFLQISISYNFIDNGLIGSRRALRGRKGCKQSLF
jgi:opacity protein-like surface antigen